MPSTKADSKGSHHIDIEMISAATTTATMRTLWPIQSREALTRLGIFNPFSPRRLVVDHLDDASTTRERLPVPDPGDDSVTRLPYSITISAASKILLR
jgi:hypothetical protein